MHEAQKVLSNNGFRMANCFCCLSQNAMVCLAHCRQEYATKVLKNCKTFSSRPRPRLHDPRPRPGPYSQDCQNSRRQTRRAPPPLPSLPPSSPLPSPPLPSRPLPSPPLRSKKVKIKCAIYSYWSLGGVLISLAKAHYCL